MMTDFMAFAPHFEGSECADHGELVAEAGALSRDAPQSDVPSGWRVTPR
jgi:hypothetical protein